MALAQRIQTTTVTSEKDNGTLSSDLTKSSKLAVDNKEDPGHVGNFHTGMVDILDEMISETSDLPLFCFHNRSSIGSPPCGHFSNSTNDPCPKERININNMSCRGCHPLPHHDGECVTGVRSGHIRPIGAVSREPSSRMGDQNSNIKLSNSHLVIRDLPGRWWNGRGVL